MHIHAGLQIDVNILNATHIMGISVFTSLNIIICDRKYSRIANNVTHATSERERMSSDE